VVNWLTVVSSFVQKFARTAEILTEVVCGYFLYTTGHWSVHVHQILL